MNIIPIYVYRLFFLFGVFINVSFAQNNWVVFEETSISSKINGAIRKGFIFKTNSGNIYEVIDYVYLYEYLYSPDVLVLRDGDLYLLYIDGIKQPLFCSKLNDRGANITNENTVIESRIDGDFEGFEGGKIFKLMNGQVWQQTEYYYRYYYHFMPEVMIYKTNSGYKMKVEGIDKSVNVTKIK